jgi:Skp family chaperone for outer membrane proteins
MSDHKDRNWLGEWGVEARSNLRRLEQDADSLAHHIAVMDRFDLAAPRFKQLYKELADLETKIAALRAAESRIASIAARAKANEAEAKQREAEEQAGAKHRKESEAELRALWGSNQHMSTLELARQARIRERGR